MPALTTAHFQQKHFSTVHAELSVDKCVVFVFFQEMQERSSESIHSVSAHICDDFPS